MYIQTCSFQTFSYNFELKKVYYYNLYIYNVKWKGYFLSALKLQNELKMKHINPNFNFLNCIKIHDFCEAKNLQTWIPYFFPHYLSLSFLFPTLDIAILLCFVKRHLNIISPTWLRDKWGKRFERSIFPPKMSLLISCNIWQEDLFSCLFLELFRFYYFSSGMVVRLNMKR